MKKILSIAGATVAAALLPLTAFAHVVVTPAQVGIGSSTSYSVSVPNERESDMTSLTLDIPKGLDDVMPDVVGGWTVTTQTSGDSVTSITWTGMIPASQRADFSFKATAPAKASDLDWKAYQTFSDGTKVSWDQKPVANAADDDAATSGPYSITKVVDDISTPAASSTSNNSSQMTVTLVLSIIALVFSIVALIARRRHQTEE